MKNIILQQREELKALLSEKYQKRTVLEDLDCILKSKVVKLITGPRRAGKSTFALQLLSGKSFAYLNFDDMRLINNFDEDIVMQNLLEIYPEFEYLFFDEIQNLKGWDVWISKLKRRGYNIVITGSNAKLLSSEMATLLTGRYVEIKILPFSLNESLQYSQINTTPILPADKAILSRETENHLNLGGFPEIQSTRQITKSYINSLVDSIILKDVIQRYTLRKPQELYNLTDYLLNNYCNQLSYNSIVKDLEIKSVTTVQRYCSYLAEPYLFFFLSRFSYKVLQVKKSPVKVYVVDNGIIYAKSLENSSNSGRLLENLVFVELQHKGYKPNYTLFYYHTKNDKEVDFITKEGVKINALIQVCYDISNNKTLTREIKALIEASKELHCEKLMIITRNTDKTLNFEDKIIQVLSVNTWANQSPQG